MLGSVILFTPDCGGRGAGERREEVRDEEEEGEEGGEMGERWGVRKWENDMAEKIIC